jgi:hypothetical protein
VHTPEGVAKHVTCCGVGTWRGYCSEGLEARGKRQEARGKRQEARGKRQEASDKRQATLAERVETYWEECL